MPPLSIELGECITLYYCKAFNNHDLHNSTRHSAHKDTTVTVTATSSRSRKGS
jgi:hypothetical protein